MGVVPGHPEQQLRAANAQAGEDVAAAHVRCEELAERLSASERALEEYRSKLANAVRKGKAIEEEKRHLQARVDEATAELQEQRDQLAQAQAQVRIITTKDIGRGGNSLPSGRTAELEHTLIFGLHHRRGLWVSYRYAGGYRSRCLQN